MLKRFYYLIDYDNALLISLINTTFIQGLHEQLIPALAAPGMCIHGLNQFSIAKEHKLFQTTWAEHKQDTWKISCHMLIWFSVNMGDFLNK